MGVLFGGRVPATLCDSKSLRCGMPLQPVSEGRRRTGVAFIHVPRAACKLLSGELIAESWERLGQSMICGASRRAQQARITSSIVAFSGRY